MKPDTRERLSGSSKNELKRYYPDRPAIRRFGERLNDIVFLDAKDEEEEA